MNTTTKAKVTKPAKAEATNVTPADSPKRQSLWDIGADQIALNALIEEVGGDVSDPKVEAAFDAMFAEMQTNEADKLEGYAQAMKKLESEIAAAKAESEQFMMKARVRENQVKRMKERIKLYLEMQNRTEAETSRGRKFKIIKAGGLTPLEIDDGTLPDSVDPKFVVVKRELSTTAIRTAIEAGESVPFAKLKERGTYVTLK